MAYEEHLRKSLKSKIKRDQEAAARGDREAAARLQEYYRPQYDIPEYVSSGHSRPPKKGCGCVSIILFIFLAIVMFFIFMMYLTANIPRSQSPSETPKMQDSDSVDAPEIGGDTEDDRKPEGPLKETNTTNGDSSNSFLRVWTLKNGQTANCELIRVEEKTVIFRDSKGKIKKIKKENLVEDDLAIIETFWSP